MVQAFFESINSDYPNIIGIFVIPIVIAIFALAFPLLFQAASRIDDKYNSTLLIKVFRKDPICKWFIRSLIFALICIILWILQVPRIVDLGDTFNVILDNSALILLTLSTIILIIMTISAMHLMYIYYMPELLLNRLINHYSKTNDKETYYEATSKLLFYSIKKEGEPLARQLQEFYYKEFILYRKDKNNQVIEYPDYFYDVMFDANECLCQRKRKSISWYNSAFYDLFIDEYQHTIISDKTFSFLWKCLCQSVFYKKPEFIISYWHKAHQYMNFWLTPINPIYDDKFKVTNQSDIDRRNDERERFLEFHYALGGLLIMKGEYTLLNQLSTWTNQTPPKYVLVPETMGEVITRFMQVESKADYLNPIYYEQRYPFPDISGVNADNIIKMWIKRYIAVLFLRQYTLNEYFVYSRTLTTPNPPQLLSEKRKWIEELDVLKKFVAEYLANQECLKSFNMEALADSQWFVDNNKTKPEDLIEKFKLEVGCSAEQKKANQNLDNAKIEQFENATKEILFDCFAGYNKLFPNPISDETPHKSLTYGGRYEVFDKMAFSTDQDMGYVNFDSIWGTIIATELNHNLPSIFRRCYNTDYYLLEEKDIFAAIDNLKLNSKDYSIVSVGVNLNLFEFDGVLTKNGDSFEYNQIPIIELECTQIDAVNNSLFIMKNEDLPCILHNRVDDKIIDKYGLKEIDNNYHIYTNVIDLNNNENIQKEVKEKTYIQDLDKKVLVCVDVNTEVRCKMDAKCIQLKLFSQFDNIGNPNKVKDVKNNFNQGLNARQIKAVLYIKENGKITNKEYQDLNSCSRATANRDLTELVNKGILSFNRYGAKASYKLQQLHHR